MSRGRPTDVAGIAGAALVGGWVLLCGGVAWSLGGWRWAAGLACVVGGVVGLRAMLIRARGV